ncbi:MAG: Phosphomannomutase [Candidatus Woesebacteria bacterium GW2011_GWA1_39_21]|uniref:Phosphomannomutase n=1 Tax=Candidatus Woesebacteria bacterium GW2011_GWA1_39_21 TaxID=1618550 RepID=A0A0G0RCW6_9BACT|nr:MAG: Phosphomannomutase [Candidatus Woesebacteria bacterium GW2011_GWA1_39_21]
MPEYTDPHFTDNIFRGYDIRGKYPDELNEAGAYTIGRAYSTFLSRRRINECVISGDNRITTPNIKRAIIDGLLDSGINVIDLGLGLVYFMYFGQYYFQSKGGVNVSASHNPKEYNGFKLAVGFSDTMITEEIVELREIAKKGKFTTPNEKGEYREEEIFSHYKNDLFKKMPDKLSFRVVVDGGNCTPGKFMPDILREAGCEVIEQNTELDGNFPLGTPDPTEREYLQRLADGVVKNKADIGFCYDPDGDRIGIVDNEGNMIWNDVLVSIFASDLLDFQPKAKIVFNTLCSKQVTDVIKERGGVPVIWLTGHSFIKAKVKEERALFGGELSGHFFFMDNFYGHDDCAFASLRLLNYLKRVRKSLKQVISELPKYYSSPEIKLGLADNIKFDFVKDIFGKELKDMFKDAKFIEIDGVRADTDTEMVIIRASQNGPYVTIKFEGKTEDQYNQLKSKLKVMLKSHREVDWTYGVNTDAFD